MISKPPENPRFFDVLCAALLTLWIIALIGLCIAFAFSKIGSLGEVVILAVGVLFFGGGTAFVLSAVVSFPLWLICKFAFKLNRNVAAIIGSVTGLIIAAILVFWLPQNFSGTTMGATREGWITLIAISGLGAFAGWNGYRVAWAEPLFKPRVKHDL